MAYTNGVQTLVQSMNGLLQFNDGAGTVIGGDTITTGTVTVDYLNVNNFTINSIVATAVNSACNLWRNLSSGVIITIGTATTPVRVAYDALTGSDLVNYRTMTAYVSNSVYTALLNAANTWTGAYNSFTTGIGTNSIVQLNTGNTTVQLYNAAGLTDTVSIAPLAKIQAGISTSNTNTHQIGRMALSQTSSFDCNIDAAGGATLNLNLGPNNNNVYIGKVNNSVSVRSNLYALQSSTTSGQIYVATQAGINGYGAYTGIPGGQICSGIDGNTELDIIGNTLSNISGKGGVSLYSQYNANPGATAPVPLFSAYTTGCQFRNCGITFDKGNLIPNNSSTGFYIQSGTCTITVNIPVNTKREITVTFATPGFAAAPIVVISNNYYNASLTNANKAIVSAGNITATQFTAEYFNVSSADITVDVPANWIAIGRY